MTSSIDVSEIKLPEGYHLRHFAEIDSTNDEAKREAAKGGVAPLWIVAEQQTAGRGRRGRTWVSPTGNLMCTLLLRPDCSPAKAGELAFVAGLALHEAAAHLLPHFPSEKITLKWPNDLLVSAKKTSGILLESESDGRSNVAWLAIGIGLNLAHFPSDTPYPATCLGDEGGIVPSVADALTALATGFERWYGIWQKEGFGRIREAWLYRAHGVGGPIVARLPDAEIEGVFEGIEPDGALRLRLPGGAIRLIAAGDVFFGANPQKV
ncbi:MAG: biotin--[acetyl-CoA-carboxylase] ligase [Parvibaculum sp.]